MGIPFLDRRVINRWRQIRARTAGIRKHLAGRDVAPDLVAHLEALMDTGVTVIEGFAAPETVARLRGRYLLRPDNFTPSQSAISWYAMDRDIFDVCTDRRLLQLLRAYYNGPAYLQDKVAVYVSKPAIGDAEFDQKFHRYPGRWHIDYQNEITAHLALTDITDDTPHTRFALGSHKEARCPFFFDENLREDFIAGRYPIRHCAAKAGDLLIMDTTGLHRACLIKDAFRAHLHIKFTPGNDLLFDLEKTEKFAKTLANTNACCRQVPTIEDPKAQLRALLPADAPQALRCLFRVYRLAAGTD